MASIWRNNLRLPFSEGEVNRTLLIESVDSNISLHQQCIYGRIICSAKNLTPVFLSEPSKSHRLRNILERYFDQFQIIDKPVLPVWKKTSIFFAACSIWSFQLLRKNLITLKWRGRLIGDIVYDQYLASCCRGTVCYSDKRLAKNIYRVLCAIETARLALNKVNPRAALLSHRVGLSAAPLAVACEEYAVPIYSSGGGMYGTLMRSMQRKDYEYTATPEELSPLLELPGNEFDRMFESIKGELFQGAFNADSKLAFANKLYTSRAEFAFDYGLDAANKNVFIMLHAFTDYPHSHFNGMLFKDFLDWFLRTLEFVSQEKSVNWIIKQHPSSHFYPVEDFDPDELKRKYSSSTLVFMPQGADFDSRSICHVGDAIVTCLGSAGFEFSALCGVPTVTASDNPYSDAGFAINPRSKQEYFDVLRNIRMVDRLAGETLQRARATFMFIHRLSRVPMHAVINLSHAEQRELQHDDKYFDMVDANAAANEDLIAGELDKYIDAVAQPGFRALRSDPSDYWGI
ncbi:MAG: hypothetical protein Q7T48_11580 [Cellvibrio sp.]|uniref:hypothetical protein n=1 Tax=Cellvibrio sp. TaxID=1965322 RepID=UPI002723A9FC|nr:hypothetical protein [Cellvibrio sp.]